MDDTTILGGVLNQLGQTAKQTVKQVVKLPDEITADVGQQIRGGVPQRPSSEGQGKLQEQSQVQKSGWKSDEERIEFLRGLYGSSKSSTGNKPEKNFSEDKQDKKQTTSANPFVKSEENKQPSEFQEQIKDKTPEEQKKLMELRSQLHKENYYDPTFNPPKKQEERPVEKVENEKKQEMMELEQKDAKKPPPLAVVRERNKAEMFRGAAG